MYRGEIELRIGRIFYWIAESPFEAVGPLRRALGALKGIRERKELSSSTLQLLVWALSATGEKEESDRLQAELDEDTRGNSPEHQIAIIKDVALRNAPVPSQPESVNGEPSDASEYRSIYSLFRAAHATDPDEVLSHVESELRLIKGSSASARERRADLCAFAAQTLYETKEVDLAVQYQKRAVDEFPAGISYSRTLAEFLYRSKRLPESLEVGVRLAKLYPGSPTGFALAGRCYWAMGAATNAVGFLERALQLSPQLGGVSELLVKAREEATRELFAHPSAGIPTLEQLLNILPPTNHGEFLGFLRGFAARVAANSEAFWKSRAKRTWVTNPEEHARSLLVQDLMAHGRHFRTYSEVHLPGGRIDLVVGVLGMEYIIELKMRGPSYSASYAEAGFAQLEEYASVRSQDVAYLVIFDGRLDHADAEPTPPTHVLNSGVRLFCVTANVAGIRRGTAR